MRILLADDHILIRENLSDFLQELDNDVTVLEAGTLEEAKDIAAGAAVPDLIILDLKMPGMNGVDGVLDMIQTHPDVPVIVLSGSTSRTDALDALNAGARGFIPKTIRGKAMLSALRLILAGETYIPPAVLGQTDEIGNIADGEPAQNGILELLTAREKEVLALLVKGYQNKNIAHELGLKEVTVKVHLQHIYQKLGVSSRTQAVAKALSTGNT
jgi:DNA-binding NarL/FixJ family response regulator